MNTVDVEITIQTSPGRGRRGRTAKAEPASRTPRITRLMALAIKFQDMVDCGEVRDYADLARLGYVSRARLTQVMNLLLLAPDLQESLLCGIVLSSQRPLRETQLRALTAMVDWYEQRREWRNRVSTG